MPEEQKTDRKDGLYIPYEAHKDVMMAQEEAHREAMKTQERHVGRLIYIIVFIVAFFIMAMLGEVAAFIWYLNQYEVVNEVVTVDSTDGVANYVGGDGSITNGSPE